MAVPGFQEFMLPLLRFLADGTERKLTEANEHLANQMGIADSDRHAMLPSGAQTQLTNRISWAVVYLAKALLVERTGRGRFRITPRGRQVLERGPSRVDMAFLGEFPEFVAFKQARRKKAGDVARVEVRTSNTEDLGNTPDERLETAYRELRETLADDLIERVRAGSPSSFEVLVVDLLVAMGYGGTISDAAQVVGKSGDDGIDGVIKEDRLGLDMVYIQAKKWDNSVGPGEIDRFVGSLMRKKAHKGVFITSGTFTSGALRAAQEASAKIVLIDGEQLAELMIDHGVGVTVQKTFTIKKIDSDYFEGQ